MGKKRPAEDAVFLFLIRVVLSCPSRIPEIEDHNTSYAPYCGLQELGPGKS